MTDAGEGVEWQVSTQNVVQTDATCPDVQMALGNARLRRRPCDPDCSWSGVDLAALGDPGKVWRCDGCGEEGTSEALRLSHSGDGTDIGGAP